MFEVYYDDDMEQFSVWAQYECGEWGFFGSFASSEAAQAQCNRMNAEQMGEAGLDQINDPNWVGSRWHY